MAIAAAASGAVARVTSETAPYAIVVGVCVVALLLAARPPGLLFVR